MSNQAITWALGVDTGSPANKVLLMALANYANEDGRSYPSIDRLAKETDQSTASVKRHLNRLVEMGLITRVPRGDSVSGGRLSNCYTLAIAQFELIPLGIKSGGVRDQNEGGLGSRLIPEPKEPKEPIKDSSDDEFEKFYRAYPRRVNRGQAIKAWRAALKKTDAQVIIDAASAFAARCSTTESRFIPHPSTWLSGERWADEPEQQLASAGWWYE